MIIINEDKTSERGQELDDFESLFYVIWGISVLSVLLNLVFLRTFRLRVNRGEPLSLVRNLLLPARAIFFPILLFIIILFFVFFIKYHNKYIFV